MLAAGQAEALEQKMHLVLTVENAGAFPDDFNASRIVESGAITIGRGEASEWRLPDTSRFLSSVHCRVEERAGRFYLTDLSRNGAILRDDRLTPHAEAELRSGDSIVLGPFLIRADILPGAPTASVVADSDRTVIAGAVTHSLEQTALTPPPDIKPQVAIQSPSASKPKAARPATKAPASAYGAEIVAHIATSAGIDPDDLAGRTDAELAREISEVARSAIETIGTLMRSSRTFRASIGAPAKADSEGEDPPFGSPALLLHVLKSGYGRQMTREMSDELLEHDRALLPALQTALFRLLNEIAPTSIEERIGAGMLRSKKAACWDEYARIWEEFSATGQNGVLDVFLAHLGDAYREAQRD